MSITVIGEPRQRATAPTTESAALRLSLLQGFQLRAGPDVVELAASAQRLVAFLALQGRPVRRSYVAGVLWSDVTDDRAAGNLRSTLWRIAEVGRPAVVAECTTLSLADEVDVDVRRTTASARWLLEHEGLPSGAADPPEPDVTVLSSDLLVDWYDDWVIVEREHHRQLRLHALEALCRRFTASGRFGRAVEAGLSAVAAEPLRESAHRTLIAAHMAEGNGSEALRQYHAFRRFLADELDLEPSRHMEALVASLLGGHRGP